MAWGGLKLCSARLRHKAEAADGGGLMDPIATTAMAIGAVLLGFVVFVLIFRWIWNRTVPASVTFFTRKCNGYSILGSRFG